MFGLAASFVADQLAAVVTAGIAEAAVPVNIAGAERVVKSLIMDLEQHIIGEVIEAAAKPLFAKVEDAMAGLDGSRSGAAAAGPADEIFLDPDALAQQVRAAAKSCGHDAGARCHVRRPSRQPRILMGEGELSAAFRALARAAAEAMERAADRIAATSESTAAKTEAGGKDLARPTRRPDEDSTTSGAVAPPKRGTEGVPEAPPRFADVEIDSTKITGYAMNPDHPVGGSKYRVIHSASGLDAGDAAGIEQQIREGVRTGVPIKGKADQYGQRWAVDVPLAGPGGA